MLLKGQCDGRKPFKVALQASTSYKTNNVMCYILHYTSSITHDCINMASLIFYSSSWKEQNSEEEDNNAVIDHSDSESDGGIPQVIF